MTTPKSARALRKGRGMQLGQYSFSIRWQAQEPWCCGVCRVFDKAGIRLFAFGPLRMMFTWEPDGTLGIETQAVGADAELNGELVTA